MNALELNDFSWNMIKMTNKPKSLELQTCKGQSLKHDWIAYLLQYFFKNHPLLIVINIV
jgi:hypothetical protein